MGKIVAQLVQPKLTKSPKKAPKTANQAINPPSGNSVLGLGDSGFGSSTLGSSVSGSMAVLSSVCGSYFDRRKV